MISSIVLEKLACYEAPQTLDALKKLNFIFGSNGTGKTTVSKVISESVTYKSCKVSWLNASPLSVYVYNRDFIEKNFYQCNDLSGIFTLGEEDIAIKAAIDAANAEVVRFDRTLLGLRRSLDGGVDSEGNEVIGKTNELTALETSFKEKIWPHKSNNDSSFKVALTGCHNKILFKDRVLSEYGKSNPASLHTLEDLTRRATTVYDPDLRVHSLIPLLSVTSLNRFETDPLLNKMIIGKADVSISGMIQKLQNSDWVKQGRGFHESNESKCPFCQQNTSEAFAKALEDYFDDSFENDVAALATIETEYLAEKTKIETELEAIIRESSTFIDMEKLSRLSRSLTDQFTLSIRSLKTKREQPSNPVTLVSVGAILKELTDLIIEANARIEANNQIARNSANSQATLTQEFWKYLTSTALIVDIQEYQFSRTALERAIKGINEKLEAADKSRAAKLREIADLERKTSSILPTIHNINAILNYFGFLSFKLAESNDGKNYKLIRPSGSDAKSTLSEGEKSFITFLYFFHLLKSNKLALGGSQYKVVVFDDPVSSLDCDVLFVVSTLIKSLFNDLRQDRGHIKQIFVLTHNVYFHKEVTFNTRRAETALNDETFWMIRKTGLNSTIIKFPNNPVKTSYELLWQEVRNPERSSLTLPNTLRRILEYYFKILGKYDLNELHKKFLGQHQIACRTLISWIHDGSHNAFEDVYFSNDHSSADIYLEVFERLFELTDQGAHFELMMGRAIIKTATVGVAPEAIAPQEPVKPTFPLPAQSETIQNGSTNPSLKSSWKRDLFSE